MTDSSYVTNGAWLTTIARPDAIDEVADQFERPGPSGASVFWDDVSVRRVAREAALRPRHVERRAG